LRTNQALLGVVANIEHYTFTGATAVNFAADGADNRITGTGKNDTLLGSGGNDTLNGGAGADNLVGGTGNDTYVVDNAGDKVDETGGDGPATVQSSISSILGAGIENLTLTGAGAINGTGNALDNILIGNSGANLLDGGDGKDTMAGGLGNDTYVVDAVGEQVTEGLNAGTDLGKSSVSFTLGDNIENLTLTGPDAIDGTGNVLANTILGNEAANQLSGAGGNDKLTGNGGGDTLDGGTGKDTMAGGLGNDTYVVDVAGETVTEAANAGTDTVK